MIEIIKIEEVKENPENPRLIDEKSFNQLKISIQNFPEMLNLRPLVIDENNYVIGGNMRLKALKELGWLEVPIIRFDNMDEEKKKEFIIKDNLSYGEWDWNLINLEWDMDMLQDWGLDVIKFNDIDVDEFFEPSNEDEEDNKKIKIFLEYTKEDYDKFQELIKNHQGSKENIILKLLEV
jgi:hypothetical protein